MTHQFSGVRRSRPTIKPDSFWESIFEAFEASSLTAKAFCAQHNIAYTTFCSRLRRRRAAQKQNPTFVPVTLVSESVCPESPCKQPLSGAGAEPLADPPSPDPWIVSIENKLSLSIPQDFSAPALARLLKVLLSC